ncbi:hypothetical protein DXT99_22655 [Pontibacter diazotrophicus]|uniref:Nuclear transport factor 2 family protein n=1 Tax=Pontibacter diazotrophicus TaxID=1400979 RepID=A0A3D8L595_9BACT|nr:hypothetical protein [Pontibacter diazotrophicus]RDV12568.1 hypothetical protein DXT99_22655 [Pontibacter diazotrophicus]
MQNIDELTQALYQSISFKKGARPDLQRLRALFYEGGRLANCNGDLPQEFSVQQFIDVVEGQMETGNLIFFQEREIASRTEIFGKIAHRFSTYEAFLEENQAKPVATGINSIQFIQVEGRWYVYSMVWNDQAEGRMIPAKYFES